MKDFNSHKGSKVFSKDKILCSEKIEETDEEKSSQTLCRAIDGHIKEMFFRRIASIYIIKKVTIGFTDV